MEGWKIEGHYSPPDKFFGIPIKEYAVFDAIDPKTGRNAGCAEFSSSVMSFRIKGKVVENPQWFFNRLYVKPEFRNRGVATALLDKVYEFVHDKDVCLYCGVNPYGDLTRKQLNDLYKKHGFRRKLVTCGSVDKPFYALLMNFKVSQ